jgi:dienelactone hydrolase
LSRNVLKLALIFLLSTTFLAACGQTSTTTPTSATASVAANVPPTVATVPATQPFPTATPVPPTVLATITPLPNPEATVTAGIAQTPQPTPTRSAATAPTQPATGFGGKDYAYEEVISNRYGENEEAYYIFEPKGAEGKKLPLVIFLHGYGGVDPFNGYRDWLYHIVRRGNIAIFPVYQLLSSRSGEKFTDNAFVAIENALKELETGKHAKPELDKVMATGYSAGGVIATNYAARAAKRGLPVPKALFAVTPGGCSNCSFLAVGNFRLAEPAELSQIAPETKMTVLVGDRDSVVGLTAGDIIWQNTLQIPGANRSYVQVITDNTGRTPLLGDHGMANRRVPDAINYYGLWRIQDALQSCAISGKGCEYALGGTPQQRFMGNWSDGRPVAELKILG